jgi:hypothetical protein
MTSSFIYTNILPSHAFRKRGAVGQAASGASGRVNPEPRQEFWQEQPCNFLFIISLPPKGMKRSLFLAHKLFPCKQTFYTRPIQLRNSQQIHVCQPRRHFLDPAVAMADRPTLVKPKPIDPSKSAIENVLELRELSAIGPVRPPFPYLLQFSQSTN